MNLIAGAGRTWNVGAFEIGRITSARERMLAGELGREGRGVPGRALGSSINGKHSVCTPTTSARC
jgi:hypothetical protein